MQSHKEPSSLGFLRNNTLKFPRSIHRFSIWFFFSTLKGKPLTRLTEASIIDEKKILIKYGNRCEGPDRLSHNLIRRKDVNLALAQFAFIFQKYEFLILKDFILKLT